MFMQGVWEVIGLLPHPQCRLLGIRIRFGAFPDTYRRSWRPLGGAKRRHGAFGQHWEGRPSAGSTKMTVWRIPGAVGSSKIIVLKLPGKLLGGGFGLLALRLAGGRATLEKKENH